MGTTITDVLNMWDSYGVFSYILPFLIIFAVVFGVLQKSKIFGTDAKETKGINAVLAMAVGLTALQFDFVSTFFATIFPRFGVGISILLVLIIMLGLFLTENSKSTDGLKYVGWIIGVLVVIWSLSNWNFWGDQFNLGFWIQDYFWTILVVAVVIGGIVAVVNGGKAATPTTTRGP